MRFSTPRFSASKIIHSTLSSIIISTIFCSPTLSSASSLQPVSVVPSTEFLGYDGAWSAVSIRVGSPQQWVSVLPSTLSQETWVIGPDGCDGTFVCQSKRGGLFFSNESSSFQDRGYYELDYDENLGDAGYGDYGLDALALDDTVSAPDQVVAVINTTDYWVGQVGLGVQQTRFNSTENQPSFVASLAELDGVIPSHSYGYTAGAFYRLKTVPASLTLGGVDTNRFTPNTMNFTLSPDYAPIVAINGISVSSTSSDGSIPPNWNTNPIDLLDNTQADLFTIDSSTPFLWMPETVCDNFANALNLTYNDTLQLYLFPADGSSTPDILTGWNLTFTFALNNLPNSLNNLELTLPYDAFNLQLSYPFPNLDADFTSPPTNYFPLRRAANNTQYTIGRVFLQETYLTVDYERNNFSISQAVFNEDTIDTQNIQTITRPSHSKWPGSKNSGRSSLSTAALVGIGIGAAVLAVMVSVFAWLYLRRRTATISDAEKKPERQSKFRTLQSNPNSVVTVSELLGDKRQPTEVAADASNTRFELSGHSPVEMPADEVSPIYYTAQQFQQDHGPASLIRDSNSLAELEHRSSTSKSPELGLRDRCDSPTPPYSPSEANQHSTSSISPYSLRNSQAYAMLSSGEGMVSPIGTTMPGNSRGSSRGSPAVSSPVSPEIPIPTSPYFVESPNVLNHHTVSYDSALLSPLHPACINLRSSSQRSRFREENLEGRSVEIERLVDTRVPSPTSGVRFSWES